MPAVGEPLRLIAADGYRLGASLFRPAAANGLALQIHAAAGVKQPYYAPFAAYLASRGFTVLTFDYRGVGDSIDRHPRRLQASMQDWALMDAPAGLSFLRNLSRWKCLMAIGHSFGGQSFAVMPGNERLDAVLSVGSQSCYWKHWSGAAYPGMWLLVHAVLPAATLACGYFPGALLRQGENLPAGVALQWASWCRHPRYLVGALRLEAQAARFQAPYRLYSIADDFYAPLASAQALLRLFPNGKGELRRVQPEELGVDRIGHFGFFRERFRDSLWREAADWLESR